jgi:outer membrane immunogenic protein
MTYLIAGALTLVIAAPAAAQDAGPVTSGARVEARVGWDHAIFKQTFGDDQILVTGKDKKSGVTYGVEAGYDFVTGGPVLIGAYAGLEDSSVKQCDAGPFGRDCLKAGRNITLGARVGYVMNRGVLYLKGGYSNGRLKFNGQDPAFPQNDFRLRKNFGGFHLGAGGEVMINRNVYGKLEYVYTNYSNDKFDDGLAFGSFDPQRHQIVAGVGFRF